MLHVSPHLLYITTGSVRRQLRSGAGHSACSVQHLISCEHTALRVHYCIVFVSR